VNLTCPKCGGTDIQFAGGKNGMYAIYTACATFFLIVVTLLSTGSWLVALVVCAGIGFAGHTVRMSFVAKEKSYRCTKCQNVFIPNDKEQAELAQRPPLAPAGPEFCPKCGAAWVAGAKSCANCG
jgi:hypothetical protein